MLISGEMPMHCTFENQPFQKRIHFSFHLLRLRCYNAAPGETCSKLTSLEISRKRKDNYSFLTNTPTR
jgi:hypothetical protein